MRLDLTSFADGLDVGCERKKVLSLTPGGLTKVTERVELPLAEIRKTARKASLGRTSGT